MLDAERAAAGRGTVRWDGRDDAGRAAAGGVYFWKVTTPEREATARMVLVR